jgi:hypothetical protein
LVFWRFDELGANGCSGRDRWIERFRYCGGRYAACFCGRTRGVNARKLEGLRLRCPVCYLRISAKPILERICVYAVFSCPEIYRI